MARNLKPAAPVLKPLDTRFADAVAVCEPHFPVWDRAVDAYVRSYEPPDGDIERQLSRDEVIGAGNVLCELLIVLCEVEPPQDRWTRPKYCPNSSGLDAWMRSEKFGVDFHLGIDIEQGIYLSTELVSPAPLWRMRDDFWWLLASMTEFGDLRLEQSECPTPPIDQHVTRTLERSRSAVFTLITNYVMFQAEDGYAEPDLGSIDVYWPGDTEWSELLRCGAECFRRLYRMNYLIYRLNYIGQKAAERHAQKD